MRIRTAAAGFTGVLALLAGCSGGADPADRAEPPTTTAPAGDTPADPDGSGDSPSDGPEPAPAAFNDQTTGTYDCGGQNITINGDGSDLHLTGACGIVVINAAQATLVVDAAEMIVVNGADSHVTYGGEPEVFVNGEDASAEPAD
ncbi:MAG TPA: DUF3060 domain-containing protein [Natronosporangium sp.]|nr:DUF3060 domain-containing protein [Natronosporangium sp.]